MNTEKQFVRLSPFEQEGKLMVDIRHWRNTAKGPRPTSKGIEIEFRVVPQMIACFQKVWAQQNAEAAAAAQKA